MASTISPDAASQFTSPTYPTWPPCVAANAAAATPGWCPMCSGAHIIVKRRKVLPQELWIQILQYVPPYEQLSACALVCQKLSRAAAATRSLDVNPVESPQLPDAFLGCVTSQGSSLTRLDLLSSRSHSSIRELACPNLLLLLQGAAWAHVFPAGRKLPHLRSFEGCPREPALPAEPQPFDSTGIARLVSCCPALAVVRINVSADASLAPLHSLTALTSLQIGLADPVAIRNDLAALSQMQVLHVSVALPVGDVPLWWQHLVPLTALTNLIALSCELVDNAEDEQDEEDERDIHLSNKAPASLPPDVWLQLLEQCAEDQAAQPAVISCMLRQLQQKRQQLAEQAARLQQQEQQLGAARAEAAAEAAGLHGQLQASESQVQQQEQRLQDVEGQLRDVLAALRHQA